MNIEKHQQFTYKKHQIHPKPQARDVIPFCRSCGGAGGARRVVLLTADVVLRVLV